MKRLKVGITASSQMPDLTGAIWSNGINQNIIFLAMTLQRLRNVAEVVLVNCPDAQTPNLLAEYLGLPTLQERDLVGSIDVLIELGVRSNQALVAEFRKRGGRTVSYVAGNTVVMNFECLANGVPYGELMPEAEFDAAWLTPQHWHTNAVYAKMTRSPNTVMAPHVWHPRCFLEAVTSTRNDPYFHQPPEGGSWRVGVFDPTVNVVKTFHMPFLVCEQAHRRRPEAIERVSMFSASHLLGVPHMEEFVMCSTLAAAKKVYAEDRQITVGALGKYVDMVVTHQWENNLNYLYWDVLYANRPLVHNSEAAQEVGYYYPAFDPAKGGDVLLEAIDTHGRRPREARDRELAFLWSLSPDNPDLQESHAKLLDELYG